MILSDRDIRAELAKGELRITPAVDEPTQLQPASIDLRLDQAFLVYQSSRVTCLDPADPASLKAAVEPVNIEPGEAFVLHPGEFALGSTLERVAIPDYLVARVDGRSSVGRLAVVVHATAGFIDPGFEGQITLELSNLGQIPVRLYPKMRIAQLVLYRMTSAAERPYGAERGSRYQGQTGPRVSRLTLDD